MFVKHLHTVALLTALLCAPALGQKSENRSTDNQRSFAFGASSATQQEKKAGAVLPRMPEVPVFKTLRNLSQPSKASDSLPIVRPDGVPVTRKTKGPEFVVKNGAVYIDMSVTGTPVYIPMSGGGASGCFAVDTDQK